MGQAKEIRRVLFSPTGSPTKKGYKVDIVNGVKTLVESGEIINVFEKIQSHKDSCDINNMIVRAQNGDTTALNKHAGVFGDFVGLPQDKLELVQAVRENENMFNKLPSDVKAKFNNNFETFILNYDKPQYYELFHNNNVASKNTATTNQVNNTTIEKGDSANGSNKE